MTILGGHALALKVAQALQELECFDLRVLSAMKASRQECDFDELNSFCSTSNVPLIVGDSSELVREVEQTQPDLVVVTGWYHIIAPEILGIPSHGFVGIHHSLLPKFRGGAPLVWALLQGETLVGSSLFKLDGTMDGGPLLHQWTEEVGESDTVATVRERIEGQIRIEVGGVIQDWTAGRLVEHPQSTAGVSYAPMRSSEDSKVDWSKSSDFLTRAERALSPAYKPLFCRSAMGLEFALRNVRPSPSSCYGKPGVVLNYHDGWYTIKCGQESDGVICQLDPLTKEAESSVPLKIGRLLN